VASKHLGHVMFYTVDIESGLMHSNVGKNFYARKKFQCWYWTHSRTILCCIMFHNCTLYSMHTYMSSFC